MSYETGAGLDPRLLRITLLAVAVGLAARGASGQVYSQIYSFSGDDGSNPKAALIRASDGNLYGTTYYGGSDNVGSTNRGTLFRLDPRNNGVTELFNFVIYDPHPGEYPGAPLMESSGYLYGTGQLENNGFNDSLVFRTDFLGNEIALNFFESQCCSCCDEPVFNLPGLTENLGNFYGPAQSKLTHGFIYRTDAKGNFATPHVFNGSDGDQPNGELTLGSDGYLYGVTRTGGASDLGTVFRMDNAGNVTTLYSFGSPPDGNFPVGRLIEANGYFYGATEEGGIGRGTIFRIDSYGNLSILHYFGGAFTDGSGPTGSLVSMGGYFYGTTKAGGFFDKGSLFQMDASGVLTHLHDFGGVGDGREPEPLAVEEPALACVTCAKRLYGTTTGGGSHGMGTIYMVDFSYSNSPPISPILVLQLRPTAGPVHVPPGVPVQIHGQQFPMGAPLSVTIGGLSATNVEVVDPETINAVTPVDLAPGTLNDVTVTTESGAAETIEKMWLADFLDVPEEDRLHGFVERVFRDRIMDGCGGGNFCEGGSVSRGVITMIALKAKHGSGFVPPACKGMFKDVSCPSPEADWIEQAVSEGIIDTCGPHKFCPTAALKRETFPAAMLKTEHGSDYVAPECTGLFGDVACPGKYADAIEQLYREGVTEACSTNPLLYCPKARLTRGPMAQYAVVAFRLP